MRLVSQGQQNAVFTDGRCFYRYAHRDLLFPRFYLPATAFYAAFEAFDDAEIQRRCEALLNLPLNSGSRKQLPSPRALCCVEIKPKCAALYRGRELFSYTAQQKQLQACGIDFYASEVLGALSAGTVTEQLLQRMGRYCALYGGCSPALAARFLNCYGVTHIARLLSRFYAWASALRLDLDEFSELIAEEVCQRGVSSVQAGDGPFYVRNELVQPESASVYPKNSRFHLDSTSGCPDSAQFLATQRCVATVLSGGIPDAPKTLRERQVVFQTLKSISDASLIAWDGGAELVDVEMKSMAAKWESWRRTYSCE